MRPEARDPKLELDIMEWYFGMVPAIHCSVPSGCFRDKKEKASIMHSTTCAMGSAGCETILHSSLRCCVVG